MRFTPLTDTEREQISEALRGNSAGDCALLINPRDTSFVGTAEEVGDDEVVMAIKSVPCHY
jgi:hypothetical protein